MKATTFFVLLIIFIIRVYCNSECPSTLIPFYEQDACNKSEPQCKSSFGEVGQCVEESRSNEYGRCCPDKTLPHVFQTNTKCDESLPIDDDYDYTFCKNGKIYTIGQNHLKVPYGKNKDCILNSDCPGENNYCVTVIIIQSRKCFIIESPKKKEDSNTMMIIIIVAVVVILIAVIVGLVATFLICKKKKGKGGQKSSAENTRDSQAEQKNKGKASKEKAKKGKKGSNV
ncbi:unnamed protein product [Caenorhabditis angaria]|uniref:Domain of unknown function DX domain-containing protein n=1 Tax=Caenorhabditis angaria TaxID=860376 RepID=A0A9P1IJR9_9PELO|nr:unnamed protein product [Caenorhabditis angaria]